MEIDHEYTNEIVCPYCGKEQSDPYDFREDDGEIQCESCDSAFSYERHRSIKFSTYKLIPANGI